MPYQDTDNQCIEPPQMSVEPPLNGEMCVDHSDDPVDGPAIRASTPEEIRQAEEPEREDCLKWFLNEPKAGQIPIGQWCNPEAEPMDHPPEVEYPVEMPALD